MGKGCVRGRRPSGGSAAAGLALALLWGGLLAGCHRQQDAAGAAAQLPAVRVRVQVIESKKRLATEEIIGTIRPKLRASVEAKVSGRIEKMLAAPGQMVKAGELLAELDVREIQARRDQAAAMQQQAERDLKRFAALLQQQAVTQHEYDAVEARQRVAKAGVMEAETMLGYAKVTAPFDGVVTRKLADVGDLAAPGRPLLDLEDPSGLRLEADVPEALIAHVQLGAKMSVHVPALPNELQGTVGEIAPTTDPNSRTFRVKLELSPAPGLRAGQFGRVSVPVGESALLRVPASALVVRGQMEIVFVVTKTEAPRGPAAKETAEPARPGLEARLRLVKTGKRVGNELEVLSGLEAGEQVVVEGAGALVDGQPVTVE